MKFCFSAPPSASFNSTSTKLVQAFLNHWIAPYTLIVFLWLLAWGIQMGPLRPIFNFAPGIELPFFPAGVRTFAVFAFGFPGAVAVFIGSLVTYFIFFPELLESTATTIVGCAAASAFSAYIAMRAVCIICKIPNNLSGLAFRGIGLIVVTQGVLSALIHQVLYHAAGVSQFSLTETIFNWGAMATGDALGSMFVLFSILIAYRLYTQYRCS